MEDTFSTFNLALAGIQRNYRGLQLAAHEIAIAPVDRREAVDLVDPLVRGLQHQHALEASANVLKRSNDALGFFIDTFA